MKVAAAAVMVAVLMLGWPQLFRPGYSPDEEYTVFAVRGIEASANHLPLLPSGLLYDRGLAYSYASWAAHLFSGAELPSYRALALVSAIASVAVVSLVVSSAASTMAGTLAVFLAAASMPFWAAATTGRFYAPLLAVFVSTLLSLYSMGTAATLRTVAMLAFLACVGRLVHELAFTVMAIPLVCAVLAPRGNRAKWLAAFLAISAGLAAAQALILGLHALAPPTGGQSMVQRFFVWQVLNLFEVPPDNQFAIPLVALFIAWVIAPKWARLSLGVALAVAAVIAGIALARALAAAPLSQGLVRRVLTDGSRYPLDMFWYIVQTTPFTIALALGLLMARLAGAGGEWRPVERAAHLLWIGWVLWFGVIESGITLNYLLLPVTLMLMTIAIDVAAIVSHNISRVSSLGRAASWSICALVVAAVAADQWRGEGPLTARLETARPTIHVESIEEIRSRLQPGDRVACTDELACLMLVGRIDAWLALDDFVRERFVIRNGDGQLVGVYTGRPALFRPAQLFDGPRTSLPANRTLIVDVFKELPVGHTRDWLPRALQSDGLTATVLLETPQARVVEVSNVPAGSHDGPAFKRPASM